MKNKEDTSKKLTISDLNEYLIKNDMNITPSSLRRLVTTGQIDGFHKLKNIWYITRANAIKFINGNHKSIRKYKSIKIELKRCPICNSLF